MNVIDRSGNHLSQRDGLLMVSETDVEYPQEFLGARIDIAPEFLYIIFEFIQVGVYDI